MSPRIDYDDFEIEVRSITKGRYEARVLISPRGGRTGSKFVPPYPADRLEGLLAALESGVLVSSRVDRDLEREDPGSEPMEPVEVEELGRRLFRSLFPKEVERCFRECLGIIRERGGERCDRGLRLRVTFDRKEDFALLATLPWEFLWDEGQFVNRSRFMPVVRSLNVPVPWTRAAIDSPLRVLLIPSNPQDLNHLETGYEARLVKEALEGNSEIKAATMEHPKVHELRPRLLEEPYHVVHFMGHGDFLETGRDEFVLYFEGEGGNAVPVRSMEFAEYLHGIPGLRLVVLNSCWSGAFPRRSGQDPFTGVAAALVARGIPAVVAMQFPISDDAAIAFSRAFYERVAAGDPVSAAVTEGRLAIVGMEPESFEWATPVVFLAGEDRGFEIRQAGSGVPIGPVDSGRPKSEPPLRLAIRSFRNPYVADTEKPDDVLDLSSFFKAPDGRHIEELSLWREEVFPRLHEFLLRYARARRPIVFDFAAHATIAFAAGYCLEAKSGLDVTLLQRGQRGVKPWRAEAGPARVGPLWREEKDVTWNPKSSTVALAVSVTNEVLEDVTLYLKRSRTAVGRIVPMTLHPQPGGTAVEDGLHALQLAQDLSLRIRGRSAQERTRPLHLFAAAPNALLFFLGQLARSFGEVQLYEHDFPSGKPGAYVPSLRLPVPAKP
jgi:hypothetical protein